MILFCQTMRLMLNTMTHRRLTYLCRLTNLPKPGIVDMKLRDMWRFEIGAATELSKGASMESAAWHWAKRTSMADQIHWAAACTKFVNGNGNKAKSRLSRLSKRNNANASRTFQTRQDPSRLKTSYPIHFLAPPVEL